MVQNSEVIVLQAGYKYGVSSSDKDDFQGSS